MYRRIPKQLLFTLRNRIYLEFLIRDILKLEWKFSENYFRYLCPVCTEFRTAINYKHNLARCFLCQRNFNSIDLVMIVIGLDFREAVNFLSRFLPD